MLSSTFSKGELEKNRFVVACEEHRGAKEKRTSDAKDSPDSHNLLIARKEVNGQRNQGPAKDHTNPEHQGLRTAKQSFSTSTGSSGRGARRDMHEGKDREEFDRFNPESRTMGPEDLVVGELAEHRQEFDRTQGACQTRHDPEERNQRRVPEGHTNGLRKQEAGIDRSSHTNRGAEAVEAIALDDLLAAFALKKDAGKDHRVKERNATLHNEKADTDKHPATEIEAHFKQRVDTSERQVENTRQVADHEERTHDTRNGADIDQSLFSHPVVQEHPHARQTDEPEE